MAKKKKNEAPERSADVAAPMFYLALAWPLVHGFTTDSGVFGSMFVGIGGTVLMSIGEAMLSGMIEDSVGRRRVRSTAWATMVVLTSLYWWNSYPWWGAAGLLATGLGLVGGVFARETRRVPVEQTLPARVEEAIATLVTPVPEELLRAVEQATDCFHTIRRYAEGELADEDAVEPARLMLAAEASLVGLIEQVRRLMDMGDNAALAESAAAGRARLDGELQSLQVTRDQLLIYAQEKASGHDDALSDRAATLRHSVSALREVHALEEGEP